MSTAELREVGDETDIAAWVDVHNAASPTPITTEELRAYRDDLDRELHLLALVDGEPAGAAFAGLEQEQLARATAEAWIAVADSFRGAGVGSALYAELSRWARENGVQAFEGHTLAGEIGQRWATRRGFVEIGRDTWLALDLREHDLPSPDPPEGVEIVTWARRPELARGIYEVAVEAYADVPGQDEDEMQPFEGWLRSDMSGPNDRPEAVFVALAGADVVGYSKLHLSDARPAIASNDMTGVKRAWRGRGIARALKRAQLAWAKDAGYEHLETMNETRNLPIQRLNETLGYRPFSERVLLRGPLFLP